MSLKLTPSTTSREDFTGTTGQTVTVIIKAPQASDAEIVHIRYAGTEIDSTPPFQFTIRKGAKFLVILAEASQAGILLQVVEVGSDGEKQVIDRFHYDPMNPARGYIIRGS